MKFKIEINTDNSAFENGESELDYILNQVKSRIMNDCAGILIDSEGHSCGTVKASN